MTITTTDAQGNVRLALVEGQALFSQVLSQALSADDEIDVVCEARSIRSLPFRTIPFDVIVLDLDGHAVEFTETMRFCRESAPPARVCVLSNHSTPEVMQRCLSSGVDGYVVKDVSSDELIRAVKQVAGGGSYVDPRVAGGLLRRRGSGDGRMRLSELSNRELEIVRLIAQGLSNKEISSVLKLSEKTVKNHVSRIFQKLNILTRTQAAVHAIKTGLV